MLDRNRFSVVMTAVKCTAAALVAAAPCGAWAQESAQPLHFSGFGTLGLSSFSASDVDFAPFPQPYGPGFSRRVDPGLDSNLAIQADAQLHKRVGASLQMLTQRAVDRSWNPELVRAHVKLALDDGLSLRLGRIGTPVFLTSDYRNVHYAQVWVRPPQELYGLNPFDWGDGVDLLGRWNASGASVSLQGGLTRSRMKTPKSNSRDTDDILARTAFLNAQVERGFLSLHAGYVRGYVDSYMPTPAKPVFDGLALIAALIPAAAELSDRLRLDGKSLSYGGIGPRYDTGQWMLQAEYGRRRSESFIGDQSGWYVTGAYRHARWTPYATVAQRKTRGPYFDTTLPRGLSPLIDQLALGVDAVLSGARHTDQRSVALGISFELANNVLLKLQHDWIRLGPASFGGPFMNHQTGFQAQAYRLLSVNVDFVF